MIFLHLESGMQNAVISTTTQLRACTWKMQWYFFPGKLPPPPFLGEGIKGNSVRFSSIPQFAKHSNQVSRDGEKVFLRHKRIPFDFQAEFLLSAVSREIPLPDISIVIAQSTAATSQKKITSSVSKSVVACAMLWIGRSQSFSLLSSLEVVWGKGGICEA